MAVLIASLIRWPHRPPSNTFTVADSTQITGIRVNLPAPVCGGSQLVWDPTANVLTGERPVLAFVSSAGATVIDPGRSGRCRSLIRAISTARTTQSPRAGCRTSSASECWGP